MVVGGDKSASGDGIAFEGTAEVFDANFEVVTGDANEVVDVCAGETHHRLILEQVDRVANRTLYIPTASVICPILLHFLQLEDRSPNVVRRCLGLKRVHHSDHRARFRIE